MTDSFSQPADDKCPHGIPYIHPTEYCATCLREAMRGQ